jgi:hypothetical protein
MWLALSGLFRARWTKEIHGEWKRNLLKNRTDLTIEQLDRTSELMDQAIPDACVYDYENLVSGLSLPIWMTAMFWQQRFVAMLA